MQHKQQQQQKTQRQINGSIRFKCGIVVHIVYAAGCDVVLFFVLSFGKRRDNTMFKFKRISVLFWSKQGRRS